MSMGYYTWDNQVSGICLSFSIQKQHNSSEKGSVFVLGWKGGETPIQLCPLEKRYFSHWTED
jgi:hypothetical protein